METTRHRRLRAQSAVGSLGIGLVLLVGCGSTIDGRASAGQALLGSIGDAPASTQPPRTSASSTAADSTAASTSSTSAAPQSTPASSSASSTQQSAQSTAGSPSNGTTPGGGDPGLTAPGTQLTYGVSAVLPFTYAGAEGVFTVSGLSVTRGSEADWATLGVDTSDAQGEEPWYLRATFIQQSGEDFSYTSVQDDLWAYAADGDVVSTAFPEDEANPLCPSTYAPADFAVGGSFDACVVLSVNLGESVDRVQFEGGYERGDPYYENPVVWKG